MTYLRAIKLALLLQKERKCKMDCFTSTICVEDEFIPIMDHLEISNQNRYTSAVHIKITTNC